MDGKYLEALPAGQLSLRCAMDLYGPDAVELVPAYLLLAEANVGESQIVYDPAAHTLDRICIYGCK